MDYLKFKDQLKWIENISKKRNWVIVSDLVIKPPVKMDQVNKIEKKIDKKLPVQFIDIITQFSSSMGFWWQLENEKPPSEFKEVFSGGSEFFWDFETFENDYQNYLEWVQNWTDITEGESDFEIQEGVVKNKFPLIFCPNGDMIVFDENTTEVFYLDHEGGSMHGRRLGLSVGDFFETWAKLGLPGPEGWQLEPFCDLTIDKLNAESETSKRWINWLNK